MGIANDTIVVEEVLGISTILRLECKNEENYLFTLRKQWDNGINTPYRSTHSCVYIRKMRSEQFFSRVFKPRKSKI